MVINETLTAEDRMTTKRIRQMGAAAFCFFLAKGLLWLALGFGAIEGCRSTIE